MVGAPGACKDSGPGNCLFTNDRSQLLLWKGAVLDPYGSLSSWQGSNPCNKTNPWAGITCSADGFDVVSVNVSGFGLSGPLPPLQGLLQLKVGDFVTPHDTIQQHSCSTIELQSVIYGNGVPLTSPHSQCKG